MGTFVDLSKSFIQGSIAFEQIKVWAKLLFFAFNIVRPSFKYLLIGIKPYLNPLDCISNSIRFKPKPWADLLIFIYFLRTQLIFLIEAQYSQKTYDKSERH